MKWYHWLGLGIGGWLLWRSSSKAKAATPTPAAINAAGVVAADQITAAGTTPDTPVGAVIINAVADTIGSPVSSAEEQKLFAVKIPFSFTSRYVSRVVGPGSTMFDVASTYAPAENTLPRIPVGYEYDPVTLESTGEGWWALFGPKADENGVEHHMQLTSPQAGTFTYKASPDAIQRLIGGSVHTGSMDKDTIYAPSKASLGSPPNVNSWWVFTKTAESGSGVWLVGPRVDTKMPTW